MWDLLGRSAPDHISVVIWCDFTLRAQEETNTEHVRGRTYSRCLFLLGVISRDSDQVIVR